MQVAKWANPTSTIFGCVWTIGPQPAANRVLTLCMSLRSFVPRRSDYEASIDIPGVNALDLGGLRLRGMFQKWLISVTVIERLPYGLSAFGRLGTGNPPD